MSRETQASLQFVIDTGAPPVAATAGPSGQIEHQGEWEERQVALRDLRGTETSIDVQGFELVRHETKVTDFHDLDALPATYDPELVALVLRVTGARRAEVFDRTVRSGDTTEQAQKSLREPLQVAHNDYTDASGPNRVRLALPDEADALLARRFAIVQVWRPTHDPIVARPLALCDARSVRREDWIRAERRHRHRVGEIYMLAHHPEQRWGWFPGMTRDEAIVFKVYDSMTDGRARFTAHGGAVLAETPRDAGPRRSIEARLLVFF